MNRILVVDDNEVNRYLLRVLLENGRPRRVSRLARTP